MQAGPRPHGAAPLQLSLRPPPPPLTHPQAYEQYEMLRRFSGFARGDEGPPENLGWPGEGAGVCRQVPSGWTDGADVERFKGRKRGRLGVVQHGWGRQGRWRVCVPKQAGVHPVAGVGRCVGAHAWLQLVRLVFKQARNVFKVLTLNTAPPACQPVHHRWTHPAAGMSTDGGDSDDSSGSGAGGSSGGEGDDSDDEGSGSGRWGAGTGWWAGLGWDGDIRAGDLCVRFWLV